MMRLLRRCTVPFAILLALLGLYGMTVHGYVDIEDSEVCYQSASNLLDTGSVAIPDTENGRALIRQRFMVVDGGDGHWYPVYPLLQLLLHVPAIALGRAMSGLANDVPQEVVRLLFAMSDVLFGALLAVVIYGIGRRLGQSSRIAWLAAMLGGIGTMLWPYAQGTLPDLPLALLTSASVLCLLHARSGQHVLPWLLLAGLLHGAACGLRPVSFLLLLPGAWFVRTLGWRALATFLLPVAAVVLGLGWLDLEVIGRPLEASYAGYAKTHPPVLSPSYTLCLFAQLFGDGRGLFVLSPLLLLAVLAWPGLRRRCPGVAQLFLGQFAILVLFWAAFDGWHGGWSWGPRYLMPVVPLLAATVGCWLQQPGLWRRALAVALIVISVGIQGLAIAVPYRIYMQVATSSPAHIYQFFIYSRYSPVVANARILGRKLRGEADVYSLRDLFGEDDARPIAVTEQLPPVDRYSAGFRHFALVRIFEKRHWLIGAGLLAGCAGAMAGGLWLGLRQSRERRDGSDDPGHGRLATTVT
ncbi:MAG: phospholipid carrier-dependent glycosyltransferase [Planctomycetes bacterium]|nr:phospholipid carrier-dependent glycosyltransferase [Planctomycetota bacterium]